MRIGENRRRQLLSHCETMAPTIIAYLVRLFSFLSVIHTSPIESIYSMLSSSYSPPFFTHSLRFPIPLPYAHLLALRAFHTYLPRSVLLPLTYLFPQRTIKMSSVDQKCKAYQCLESLFNVDLFRSHPTDSIELLRPCLDDLVSV